MLVAKSQKQFRNIDVIHSYWSKMLCKWFMQRTWLTKENMWFFGGKERSWELIIHKRKTRMTIKICNLLD